MSWVDAEWIFINKHSLWTQCVAQFHGFRLSFCARADPLDETDDLKVLIKVSSGAFCWLCKVFPMCPGSGEFSPWNPLPQGIAPCLRGDAPGYCLFPNWRYLLLPRTLLSYFELTCQYIMARVRNSLCWKGGAGGSARNKISNWWEDNIFSMSVSWKGSVRSLNIGSPSRHEYRVGIWYHKVFRSKVAILLEPPHIWQTCILCIEPLSTFPIRCSGHLSLVAQSLRGGRTWNINGEARILLFMSLLGKPVQQ